MFQITEFMKKLDELYQKKQLPIIESYLNDGISEALGRHDEGTALILLNELMGYYRSVSRHADCAKAAEQALALITSMGLERTVNHGTTLLNAATGLRAAGKNDQAEKVYQKAQAILETQLPAEDYRQATLYNNMSLLYAATGRLEQAAEYARKAVERMEQNPDAQVELAISLSNLGGMYTRLGQSERAQRCLERAVRLFEQLPGGDDPHYPAALCALAELHFHQGEPEKSAELFRRALGLIERTYGRNDDWQTTRRNLSSVQDGPWNVSSETYLRGELGTYSDETLGLYAQMVLDLLAQGENLVEQNMTCMARGYGYRSLEDAENACAAQSHTGRP